MDLAIKSNHLAQGISTPELTRKIFYASQEKRDRDSRQVMCACSDFEGPYKPFHLLTQTRPSIQYPYLLRDLVGNDMLVVVVETAI